MRAPTLAIFPLVATACLPLAPSPPGPVAFRTYVDAGHHYAIDLPPDWRGPAREDDGEIIAFRSPEGATALVRAGPIDPAAGCFEGAVTLLGSRAAAARAEERSVAEARSLRLLVFRGRLEEEDRNSRLAGFCDGDRAVVLEVSAADGAPSGLEGEAGGVFDSFVYRIEERIPVAARPDCNFEHVVRWRGQTLEGVAAWYTGSGENWKELAKPANPPLSTCCAPLRLWRTVKIRCELVTRTDELPPPPSPPPDTGAPLPPVIPPE